MRVEHNGNPGVQLFRAPAQRQAGHGRRSQPGPRLCPGASEISVQVNGTVQGQHDVWGSGRRRWREKNPTKMRVSHFIYAMQFNPDPPPEMLTDGTKISWLSSQPNILSFGVAENGSVTDTRKVLWFKIRERTVRRARKTYYDAVGERSANQKPVDFCVRSRKYRLVFVFYLNIINWARILKLVVLFLLPVYYISETVFCCRYTGPEPSLRSMAAFGGTDNHRFCNHHCCPSKQKVSK